MKLKHLALGFLIAAATSLGACSGNGDHGWLGYAEGDYAYVSAPLAGWATDVKVQRGQWVKKGDVLFVLDDTSQVAARDQARAAIALAEGQMGQAEANRELAEKEWMRQQGLMRANATSKQAYDQAKSNYDAAVAQVAQITANQNQAHATLSNAAYQLSQRAVLSLTVGRVQDVYVRTGEYVPAMTPVVSVLPPNNVFVRFFVPEDQFAKIHLGQKVRVHCDGCASDITATVTFIASQEEYTPPVIFSNQSRQQLVFKVEARAPGGLKLNPGQPVDVYPL